MLQKSDPLNLTGKVAVVTGGGSGIGLGVAQMLSAYGAKVAIVDVSPKSEESAQEMRDAGREAAFFQCDITNEESVIATVKAIVEKFGRIDILHNNAGVTVRKTIEDLSEKEWDFVLDVGLKGLFLMSKYVIPEMRKLGGIGWVSSLTMAALTILAGLFLTLFAFKVMKVAVMVIGVAFVYNGASNLWIERTDRRAARE